MKGSTLLLILGTCIAAVAFGVILYLDTLNRFLQRHHDDMAATVQDLSSRRAGCEAALADMDKFQKHLDTFLSDREKEISQLEVRIAGTRKRIGNVEEIREEYLKFEKELESVKKLLSVMAGEGKGGR